MLDHLARLKGLAAGAKRCEVVATLEPLYLEKRKIEREESAFTIVVDRKPARGHRSVQQVDRPPAEGQHGRRRVRGQRAGAASSTAPAAMNASISVSS
jgi:hypothetical protein